MLLLRGRRRPVLLPLLELLLLLLFLLWRWLPLRRRRPYQGMRFRCRP